MSIRLASACAPVFLLLADCGKGGGAPASARREVVDLAGRKISIPARVSRIGCMTGASFEKALLVGGAGKVVVKAATCPPWVARVHPAVDGIRSLANSHGLNLEEFHRIQPDVLFFWDDEKALSRFEDNGIPALVPQPTQAVASETEFVQRQKDEAMLYGKVLGTAEEGNARRWCAYYDAKIAMVRSRTRGLPPQSRPRVYYVRGPKALNTHGADGNITWYGEMAGGRMVVRESGARGIADLSVEQILRWNPEVILVGRQYPSSLVLDDHAWREVAAVRSRRVLEIPDGVFWWDSGSEGVLLLLYLAKTFHPDLFADLDLRREVRDYYRRFYHVSLSEREIDLMLAGKGPNGSRGNRLGN
jgi:iron complex transport system substrate-binding protein